MKLTQMLKINFYATTILSLFLLFTLNAYSQVVDIKLSAHGQQAYETLLVAKQFEGTHLGYAAERSKLVEAYNVILKEPEAGATFKLLLEKAMPPGQLYALCGLWFTDNTFFRTVIENYRHTDKYVPTQFGCIGGARPVMELIEAEKPIIIDVNRPKESLEIYTEMNRKLFAEWDNRKKKKKTDRPPQGYQVDILNGGYAVSLRTDVF